MRLHLRAAFAREPVSGILEDGFAPPADDEVGGEGEVRIANAGAKSCSAAGDEHALGFQKIFFEHHCSPMLANTMTSHHHGCANWGRSCARRSGSIVSESGNIIAETVARIFADLADPQAVNSAADRGWMEPLWRALAQTRPPLPSSRDHPHRFPPHLSPQ